MLQLASCAEYQVYRIVNARAHIQPPICSDSHCWLRLRQLEAHVHDHGIAVSTEAWVLIEIAHKLAVLPTPLALVPVGPRHSCRHKFAIGHLALGVVLAAGGDLVCIIKHSSLQCMPHG